MTEPKWTPGPWKVGGYMAVRGHTATIETNNERVLLHIATVFTDRCDEWSAANSRLIAAAPELYEALKNLVIGYEGAIRMLGQDPSEGSRYARAVLAKARGETE